MARASHRFGQLLTPARLDGSSTTPAHTVDLVALTRAIVIDLAPLATARSMEITLQSPDHVPAVVPASAWQSILEKLLGNALKYCPAGSTVDVVLSAREQQVHLAVQDNGPGRGDDDLAQAFARFRRGRDSAASGAGLGLSSVQEAAHGLGGHAGARATNRGQCWRVEGCLALRRVSRKLGRATIQSNRSHSKSEPQHGNSQHDNA